MIITPVIPSDPVSLHAAAVMLLSGTRRNGTGVNLGVIYRGVIAKGVNATGHIYQGEIVSGLMSYIRFKRQYGARCYIGVIVSLERERWQSRA